MDSFKFMRVLIACECSQLICSAFRSLGHEAYSCDLEPAEINKDWHIQEDVLLHLNDGWDLMIAHPPCTHLATSGARHFDKKRKDGRQQSAIDFFMEFTKTNIPRWCIENPMGIMSTVYRKPDQIIHPYHFGDKAQKTTCLWIYGLPKLKATHHDSPLFGVSVDKGEFYEFTTKEGKKKKQPMWFAKAFLEKGDRAKKRSFRYPNTAKAIAEQWSKV